MRAANKYECHAIQASTIGGGVKKFKYLRENEFLRETCLSGPILVGLIK